MKRERIVIVLVEPGSPGNIGSTVRAMKNLGFDRLRLVRPVSWRDNASYSAEASRMAWGAVDLLERIEHYDDLAEAVRDVQWVYGTSARPGRYRDPISLPLAVDQIGSYSDENDVAIIFGPEQHGLRTRDLSHVQHLITIPTADEYPTLNLAQAVLIVCYQLHLSGRVVREEGPDWAPQAEIQAMYDQMKQTLYSIGFLKHQNPEHAFEVIKKVLGRSGLTRGEVRTLRGVFHQVAWAAERWTPPLGLD
ncbi:RNA methyltransferase [bacterium]|nr:RNA methyltransferase [bacterium]